MHARVALLSRGSVVTPAEPWQTSLYWMLMGALFMLSPGMMQEV